jgi:predicted secreted protein
MNATRDAILNGTRAAVEAHRAFRIRELVEQGRGAVDVFGTIEDLGIPLMFRPLDNLLGACIRLSPGLVGILVTTERDLHMQRFTAAHELGHFVLEHQGSLDREVRWPGQTDRREPQEIEADAFAAEFLMPKWLYRHVARRHGWSSEDLSQPDCVYQLSLRLAVSYEAVCWGLTAQGLISLTVGRRLASAKPKDCKRRALGGITLDDPWANVWVLDAADQGVELALGPNDVLVLSLEEHSGGGYLWNAAELEKAGFSLVQDERVPGRAGTIGGPTRRRLVARAPSAGKYGVTLAERRPWLPAAPPIGQFELRCSTFGKEKEGQFHRGRAAAAGAVH